MEDYLFGCCQIMEAEDPYAHILITSNYLGRPCTKYACPSFGINGFRTFSWSYATLTSLASFSISSCFVANKSLTAGWASVITSAASATTVIMTNRVCKYVSAN
jgi:hypothetical protein